MRARQGAAWLEALLIVASLGCSRPDSSTAKPLLSARRASPFVCAGASCRQEHPRLPDTGEWRCAEREGGVWCAGGEPAAGVVKGAADPAFRCAVRWGNASVERVCIAQHPDYPDATGDGYRCSYEQELGIARVCTVTTPRAGAALPSSALPACWLDADCRSKRCDRGACRCGNDADCVQGHCREGLCAGAAP